MLSCTVCFIGKSMPSSASANTKKPMDSVRGNPIPNRLSCGAVLVRMPSAILVTSSAVTAGSARSRPVLNMVAPQSTIFMGLMPALSVAIGMVVKLLAMVLTTSR